MGQTASSLSSSPSDFSADNKHTIYYDGSDAKQSSYRAISTFGKEGEALEKFFNRYELLPDRLGQGSFSEVRLATDKEEDMTLVAVKVVMKDQISLLDIQDHRRECEILKNLSHNNVVKIYEYYEDKKFMFIVMEYASAGELVDKLEHLEDFSERETRDIMWTLIDALYYCKRRGIAHRDIKPSNILLREVFRPDSIAPGQVTRFRHAKKRYEVVLADFGFAKQVSKESAFNSSRALRTQCGSPLFVAPEILDDEPYNYKCDIWSLGVLCFMMLSGGVRPFEGDDTDSLFQNIIEGNWEFKPENVWENVSKYAKKFVTRCLVVNDSDRATYEELINCEWFKKEKSDRSEIDMTPLKKYNSDRKLTKEKERSKKANRFRSLMEDLDEEHKLNGSDKDTNLGKYLRVNDISVFYSHPKITTEAEKRYKKRRKRNRKKARKLRPPRNIDEIHPREVLHTIYFKDVDNLL